MNSDRKNEPKKQTSRIKSRAERYCVCPWWLLQPYGHLVSDRRSGTSSFYRYDAIQSTTALTNSAGTTTDEFRYKAYGSVLYHTGTSDTPYQYVGDLGYRQDPDTGSLNLRERLYASKTGRFESEDPLREDAGDSNFYRYVANDPINKNDPSGLNFIDGKRKSIPLGTPPVPIGDNVANAQSNGIVYDGIDNFHGLTWWQKQRLKSAVRVAMWNDPLLSPGEAYQTVGIPVIYDGQQAAPSTPPSPQPAPPAPEPAPLPPPPPRPGSTPAPQPDNDLKAPGNPSDCNQPTAQGNSSDTLASLDSFFGCWADSLTFGYSTKLREFGYGPQANANLTGTPCNVGYGLGLVHSLFIGGIAKGASWALNVAQGYGTLGFLDSTIKSMNGFLKGEFTLSNIVGILPFVGRYLGKSIPSNLLKGLSDRLKTLFDRLKGKLGRNAPNGKVTLNVVEGTQTAPAKFVRTLKPGEKIPDLIAEGKSATWVNEAEHAIVSLTGEGKIRRVVVSGGRDGIDFIQKDGKLFFEMDGRLVQVRRVLGHTHPRATGPSQGDLDVMKILGQSRSYIFEIGGEPGGTIVRPK
ncbi:RHS repeat-associated core domain-containing protein [Schlesneria sp. T3-172]|uniref:RHS repeat-associated core domain-containing protein n=1 Tax=Schlesneria sphaerica TaxID=3373610 RepID=UPI0037CB03E2